MLQPLGGRAYSPKSSEIYPVKNGSFYKRTWFKILAPVLLVLIIARILAPGIILKKLNQYLENFSPVYALHIGDVDLHFWRMAYSFDHVTGHLKKENSANFLEIENVDVSAAWRALLKGKVVADVDLTKVHFIVTTENLNAVSGYGADATKKDAKNVKEETVPFDLERLRVRDSQLEFSDVAGLPPKENFTLSNTNATINNLTPHTKDGISIYTATGDLQGEAKLKIVGQLRPNASPVDWNENLELKNFNLTLINPIARRMVPLTFKSGTLSLYSAAQSKNGKILGYVKPFMKDMVFIGDRGDFKNVGQFFIEIAGTLGNFFLKNHDNKALATKVEFKTVNGKIETNTGKALKIAIDNGFGDALPQKVDETLDLE